MNTETITLTGLGAIEIERAKGYVVVEYMPALWRESHCGGRYPTNGAARVLMTCEEAERLCRADRYGYDYILRDATLGDMSRYPTYK